MSTHGNFPFYFVAPGLGMTMVTSYLCEESIILLTENLTPFSLKCANRGQIRSGQSRTVSFHHVNFDFLDSYHVNLIF
jgi:hypothetical protein